MNIVYKLIAEQKYLEEYGAYIGYGIAVYEKQGKEEKMVEKISDVSINKKMVERLVTLCNKLELSRIHLWDVVEDAIN